MRDPNHLTPRKDGRFCKKIRGRIHYFGANGDRDQALREWLEQKEDLLAGRIPRPKLAPPDEITVAEVINHYLFSAMQRRQAGEIRPGTYGDYFRACTEFGNFSSGAVILGARLVESLTPDDFASVRAAWSKRLAAWALDRHIQSIRTMFNYAVDVLRMLDRQPWYGDRFSKTSEGNKRAEEAVAIRRRGERLFSIDEIAAILNGKAGAGDGVPGVSGQLRAMVMLGLNGGMNATDCAWLRRDAIRKTGDIWLIEFIRGKTASKGVRWTFPLWPETKTAIDAATASRPSPRLPEHDALIFLTAYGRPWASQTITTIENNPEMEIGGRENVQVHQAFTRKLDALGIRRDRVAFGAFRHTHISATADHPDQNARYRVRGHKISAIEKHYDKIPLPRLQSVTDLARERLILPLT